MNLFSFIKERISILDVVNEYVTLKRAGGYHKGTCPFHHEKTASFTVSPDKQIFYCFGCHLSGDVISFIAKIENCSQKDAAKFLVDKYQLDLPQNISIGTTEKNTEEKNHYFNICKMVALWCNQQLLKNQSAQHYFRQRNFDQKIFDYFILGYFPSGNTGINDLLYAMKKESILSKDLVEANILAQGRTTLYSPFEDRLIFPIKDALGHYCGFGGRTFNEHDTRPKYYNSRENEYFIKGSLLFNLDKAKKSIQETGIIFLVEGYTDCMAMIQHGLYNTVATLGTACTIEHLKQLARYAERINIIYDNDNAGNSAILRLTELCWQVNLELKVIVLPPKEDPASFLAHNGNIQALAEDAQDIFVFFITMLGNNFAGKTLNKKIQIIRSFLTIIGAISDSLKQDLLLQKASKTFDIPFDSLKQELCKLDKSSQIITVASNTNDLVSQSEQIPLLEKRIFCAIMNNMQLLDGDQRQKFIKYLPAPLQNILIQLKEMREQDKTITFSIFFDTLSERDSQYISQLLIEENDIVDTAAFEKLLEQLQKKQWKLIVQDIKIQLAHAKQEGNKEKVSLILQDFMELQSKLASTPYLDAI